MGCQDEATCDFSCHGGSCEMTCEDDASCDFTCNGGDCSFLCSHSCSTTCGGATA